uniref:Sushi domain-containing protein n=1 Tax=Panagrolaimus sp. ES5 TaxID=591445 RepID=A0AC34G6T3_9BILA
MFGDTTTFQCPAGCEVILDTPEFSNIYGTGLQSVTVTCDISGNYVTSYGKAVGFANCALKHQDDDKTLSCSAGCLVKFRMPSGAVLTPANQVLVFTCQDTGKYQAPSGQEVEGAVCR